MMKSRVKPVRYSQDVKRDLDQDRGKVESVEAFLAAVSLTGLR